jgi:hypothetical protein
MGWDVSAEMSDAETRVAKRLHRVGRFYVFLREVRRELFEGGFEEELEAAYKKARGTEPLPPALLAMVTLLQAYDQVSDADAVITAQMDKRWQLVLGCLGAEEAPRRATREGRAELRQRVTVEHSLAVIAAIQGPRARYKGIRKNSLDLRRCAAVANLQVPQGCVTLRCSPL